MASKKTVIVTGASQGIGAAVVQAFLGRGYNVVATSRSVSKAGFAPSPNLALASRSSLAGLGKSSIPRLDEMPPTLRH
jgi:NAD(P)-dependent dehydrogenase (short-subunit alcohol dehydrogenase family)